MRGGRGLGPLFSWNCWFRGFLPGAGTAVGGRLGPGQGLRAWGRCSGQGLRVRALRWVPAEQPVSQGKQEEDAVVEKLNLFLDLLQSYKVRLGCASLRVCAWSGVNVRVCVHVCMRECVHVCLFAYVSLCACICLRMCV